MPFEYQQVYIKRKNENNDINSFFSESYSVTGLSIQTSDLVIPRKYRQKSLLSDQLLPSTHEELASLYATQYLKSPARRLWVDLALLTGMRAFEIADFKDIHVIDPSFSKAM